MRKKCGYGICSECGEFGEAKLDDGIQVLDGPFGTMPYQVQTAQWFSACCHAPAEVDDEPEEE